MKPCRGRSKSSPPLDYSFQRHVLDKLLAKCRQLGLKQEEMANACGLGRTAWDKKRACQRPLRILEVYQAACFLGCANTYLQFFEGYKPTHKQSQQEYDATQPRSMLS